MGTEKLKLDNAGRMYTESADGRIVNEGTTRLIMHKKKIYADKKFMAYLVENTKIFDAIEKEAKDKDLSTDINNENGFEVYSVKNKNGMRIFSLTLEFEYGMIRGHRLKVIARITPGYLNNTERIKEAVLKSKKYLTDDALMIETKCNKKIEYDIN